MSCEQTLSRSPPAGGQERPPIPKGLGASPEQYVHLVGAISKDPELWHAWRLTQTLHGVYEADDEAAARAVLEEFVAQYAELPIPELKTILKVLAQRLPEILAFHSCDRITNGRLEGVNNKLGVLKRIAYGFKNPRNFEARALLICPAVTCRLGAELESHPTASR